MSGRNNGLRRAVYRKSEALEKREVKDVFDFKVDYSNKKSWQDCISRIAIAQATIGIKPAMACVESVVRGREFREGGYVYCSPVQLKEALVRMQEIYLRMNQKK